MSNKQKIVIVGAGPTGIGAVSRISDLIENGILEDLEVSVVEKEPVPGGLASTVTDHNGFSWDLGVHITGASRFSSFLKTLQSVVPEWHCIKRTVKADMKHVLGSHPPQDPESNYVPYPVQSSVPYFPEDVKQTCVKELQNRFQDQEKKDFANFEEFSLYFFGKTLQEIFIRPYNEKVWTVKLNEMNCKWVEGRVPKVDLEAIQMRAALDKQDLIDHDAKHDRSFFRYPADCLGMGELWKRVVAKYPKSWFRFSTTVTKVNPEKKEITVREKSGSISTIQYDFLISTIPLTVLGKITGLCPDLNLKHSKVALVGIGLRLPRSDFTKSLSWAYFPRPEIIFYRCTVISNFSPLLVPDPSRFWSVLCEIGLKSDEKMDSDFLLEKTVEGLLETGIISSVDQVYSSWNTVLDYGYPIPSIERQSELDRATEVLESRQIFSRGRFGGWKYEMSNQDCSFEIGRQLVGRVLLQEEESLF